MASFRVRQPIEYLRILWRRRYYVLVPFLLVTATLCYGIYRLPNIYESTTLLIVDPPKVDPNVIRTPVAVDITSRLNAIRQQVLSRSNLAQLIAKYDLYSEMKQKQLPTEVIQENMQSHIDVQIRNTSAGANAFTISYKGQNPEIVQQVTADLADSFATMNHEKIRGDVANTVAHLDNELTGVKKRLEDIQQKRVKFISENPTALKDQSQSIVGQMTALSTQIQAQRASIASLETNVATYDQMLRMEQTRVEEIPAETGMEMMSAGQVEGPLRVKRAELQGKLKDMLSVYTEKHPDVKATRAQLEQVEKELADLDKKVEDKKVERVKSVRRNSKIDTIQLQIDDAKRNLKRKEDELARMHGEMERLNSQMSTVAPVNAQMEMIQLEYDTLKRQHDELLTRRDNAKIGQSLVNDFNGESFRVQDPANLPEAPTSPRRGLLYPLSLILGLISGLIVALAFEARYLATIRDGKDVEHYTKLPLLVTVPEIITEFEERRRRTLSLLTAVGVVVMLLVAVPVLGKVLEITRILSIFTGGY
jgi:polysaccharide chain length determinant protein (PEP-CTERM system associated)